MYIWNINKLKKQLLSQTITERDNFNYLLANMLIILFPVLKQGSLNNFDIYNDIANLIITVAGLLFVYHCNGGKNGSDIIIRYLAIAWVSVIRLTVILYLPFSFAFYSFQYFVIGTFSEETNIYDLIYWQICEVVFFLYVARNIYSISIAGHKNKNVKGDV